MGEHSFRPEYSHDVAEIGTPVSVSIPHVTPQWAWGGATGKGVRVALVDSGIEADHPALEGCVDMEASVTVSLDSNHSPTVTPGPHSDDFGHGTACAGIIHSIAPEARLTSVKVLSAHLSGKSSVFLRGVAWAVEQGFDVVNLSLGTADPSWALPFYEICDRAYFHGCTLVTAANNFALPSYPSMYASVASVACNLSTNPMEFDYNPQPPTEFLAPGIDVDLAWSGGGRRHDTGNSYAAPHITGIVALIRSKHPALRPVEVKAVLCATAANVRIGRPIQGLHVHRAVQRAARSPRAVSAIRST
ncbi:MAG: hypothetical protein NVS4B2_23610 [Chloroflexota bacterium]